MLIQTVIMETFVKFNGTNVFQDLILVILLLVDQDLIVWRIIMEMLFAGSLKIPKIYIKDSFASDFALFFNSSPSALQTLFLCLFILT